MENVVNAKEKPKRSLEEIRTHYKELCNAAGQLQYQIKVQEMELQAVIQVMSDVNREAAEAVEAAKGDQNGETENH